MSDEDFKDYLRSTTEDTYNLLDNESIVYKLVLID